MSERIGFTAVRVCKDGTWDGIEVLTPLERIEMQETDIKGKPIGKPVVIGGEKEPWEMAFTASPDLFLIREAWHQGCDFEDECDGYGAGAGTHGDWSGIRDSSRDAKDAMLTKALNWFFGSEQALASAMKKLSTAKGKARKRRA